MSKPQLKSKDKYKVLNWSSYNKSLINRGSINIWINEEVIEAWTYQGNKKKGGQTIYSDLAIEICASIKRLYKFGYRQTEGFIKSIFSLMKIELSVPAYTQMQRRIKSLKIDLGDFSKNENIDIVIDSTGLKVFGEGEWKVRKHGWSKHRTWRKLHIVIDPQTQEIIMEKLTENSVTDEDAAIEMIETMDLNLNSLRGDGAYDKTKLRRKLSKGDIEQIIPPQRNAVISKKPDPEMQSRNEAIKRIKEIGRKKWKQEIGYHKRSLAEVAMFRYKTIIGDKISSRRFENEKIEVRIGCKILNKLTSLGMPVSIKIA
jgi:Transposase DDE domain